LRIADLWLRCRLTSRAWAADPHLNRLYKQFVVAKDALVSLIENSNLLGEKFKRYVARSEEVFGIRVSNLSLARHRADSTQKPLARLVLFIDAMFAVAADISCSRRGREAQIADTFLQMSAEDYLQLAMMADAGDEAIQLVRLCDSESFDPATTPAEVGAFRARIRRLFMERGCLELPGFTRFAMDILKLQRVYTRRQGQRLRFGCGPAGAPLDIVNRCLERMHGWCVIAISVLDAEFPDFEILQSFSVFNIGGGDGGRRGSSGIVDDGHPSDFNPAQLQHIDRLAKTFHVSPRQLQEEIADFRPRAAAEMKSSGCLPQEAWRKAVQKVMLSIDLRVKERHPLDALVPVLTRWLTLVCTTSAVEQGFAKMLHTIRVQQRAGPNAEADAAKCVLDWDPLEAPQVLEGAQRAWAAFYGAPRKAGRARLDKGAARPLAEFDSGSARNSEISFLRARRRAVQRAAVGSAGIVGAQGAVPLPQRWTAEQAAEVAFQRKKREHRLVQALQEGALAQNEITEQLKQAHDDLQKKEVSRERVRKADQQRSAALRAGALHGRRLSQEDLRDKAVWVEAGVLETINGGCHAFMSAARKLRMRLVEERCQARAALIAVRVSGVNACPWRLPNPNGMQLRILVAARRMCSSWLTWQSLASRQSLQ
jgi:hypothetical protein